MLTFYGSYDWFFKHFKYYRRAYWPDTSVCHKKDKRNHFFHRFDNYSAFFAHVCMEQSVSLGTTTDYHWAGMAAEDCLNASYKNFSKVRRRPR